MIGLNLICIVLGLFVLNISGQSNIKICLDIIQANWPDPNPTIYPFFPICSLSDLQQIQFQTNTLFVKQCYALVGQSIDQVYCNISAISIQTLPTHTCNSSEPQAQRGVYLSSSTQCVNFCTYGQSTIQTSDCFNQCSNLSSSSPSSGITCGGDSVYCSENGTHCVSNPMCTCKTVLTSDTISVYFLPTPEDLLPKVQHIWSVRYRQFVMNDTSNYLPSGYLFSSRKLLAIDEPVYVSLKEHVLSVFSADKNLSAEIVIQKNSIFQVVHF